MSDPIQCVPQNVNCFNINGIIFNLLTDQERAEQLARIEESKVVAELTSATVKTGAELVEELATCMKDFEYWCENYVWTFDPRAMPSGVRFILYDFQKVAARQIIHAIKTGESLLIEKSRDLGASWLMMTILTWFWLFNKEFHAHVGSRVEDQVDNGTVDSLLGKLDYIVGHLPDWMRRLMPYTEKDGRKNLQRKTYEGSLISGESSNRNFGRGLRKACVYIDEMAYVEEDRSIWVGIADVAPCKIVASTPAGDTNQFAELRFSGRIPVLTFHWSQHPLKTMDWYRKACSERTPLAIATELDVDYKASGGTIAFPEISLHRKNIIVPPFDLDPEDFDFDMGLDYGTVNPSAICVVARSRIMRKSQRFPTQYVAWEFYQPANVEAVSNALHNCPLFPLVRYIWSDPSLFFNNQFSDDQKATTNLAQLFYQYYNITLSAGKRGDAFVINQLHLAWQDPASIGVYVFESCPNFIKEFEKLHYKTQSASLSQKRNASEQLVDKDNHLFDAFKYYYNRTFDAPVEAQLSERKLGYDAFNDELKGLMHKKISELTKNYNSRNLQRKALKSMWR
jgi:hypothetical protein